MISIIVPVYNVASYLDRCFQSINAQTLSDFEVIVINDGSTDNSLEICKRYAAGNTKYHLYSKENGGLMSAWMYGVERAKGDYFGFVDSDDYVADSMFEKLYLLAKDNNCDIVMCEKNIVLNGIIIRQGTQKLSSGLYQGTDMSYIKEIILPQFSGWHISNSRCNKLFRRELFMQCMKYCEHKSRICEDRFITPACVFAANSFYYTDEPLYYYVQRAGSNHSRPYPKFQDTIELLYKIQMQIVIDNGLVDNYSICVERAVLNYFRLMMMRNFAGFSGNIGQKLDLAKSVLKNDFFAALVKKYKADLMGKAGLAVKIAFATHNRYLFVFMCLFIR